MKGKIVKVKVTNDKLYVTIEGVPRDFAISVAQMRNYDRVNVIGEGYATEILKTLVVKESKND